MKAGNPVKCYYCTLGGEARDAVGVCATCGRAVCAEHSKLRHTPRFRRSEAGIGGPFIRLPEDAPRLLCRECASLVEPTCETQTCRLG